MIASWEAGTLSLRRWLLSRGLRSGVGRATMGKSAGQGGRSPGVCGEQQGLACGSGGVAGEALQEDRRPRHSPGAHEDSGFDW